MLHDAEFVARGDADTLGGRVGGANLRMSLLEFFEPPHQLIIFGVGYFRIVENIIPVIVMINLFAERLCFRFESIEMVENSFLRLTFSVQNSFDSDVDLRLNNPAQNTYVVDISGNSYNFMSGEGLQQNFTRHIRAGENAQFSLLFKIPAATVRSVTLRTTWDAYGQRTSGTKRFVQENVHIPGR